MRETRDSLPSKATLNSLQGSFLIIGSNFRPIEAQIAERKVMSLFLVVVESPAKAKTIEKYLGKGFKVMASYGHVRDLMPKEGAVDPEHDFIMRYQPIDKNSSHMEAIAKTLKKCAGIYLAPDPDREGEAIAWHIKQLLAERGAIEGKEVQRIVFNEVTKTAIAEAIKHPREISMDLVNAQQARRALDYLVGFNLSPLLWRKIRPGLSAGRVQSPALRMIAEREEEIEKFISEEYWTIHSLLLTDGDKISARLVQYEGKKVEQFTFTQESQVEEVVKKLKELAKGKIRVTKITKKTRKRQPSPPFITATLQQEAARKLGFTAQRTMRIAQQLYEGIDIGEGSTGLITYMRTDSVNLSQEAITQLRDFIFSHYGEDQLPQAARIYKSKSKNAQEAHEAIRPTFASYLPEKLKSKLTPEQFKLYSLIWQRTVASQMIDALIDTVAVDFSIAENIFRANGSTIVKPGFMHVYQEGQDEKKAEDENKILPPLEEGQELKINKIFGEQHFTEPPPRYSEASLVKALEEHDIGRPSTYATIIATLKNREYVILNNKRFSPTDVGRVVNHFLTHYFPQYVDYDFTAQLEDQLDEISRGDKAWVPVLKEFWHPFKELVEYTQEHVKRSDVTQEKIDEKCPKCSKQLSIRLGKRGRFIGCTGYPDCDYTRNLSGDEENKEEDKLNRKCPKCQSELLVRHGPYGKFIGCSNYPNCRFLESFNQPSVINILCPSCKKGQMTQRRTRHGKIFFSCSLYPDCNYAVWDEPIAGDCPKCNWSMLVIKRSKRAGAQKKCPQNECDYQIPYEE